MQCRFVIVGELFDHPVTKCQRPRFDALGAGTPVQFAQVVGDAAGADQQDVLLAQACQCLADTVLQFGPLPAG
ncbi:hypothetical protein D3C86_1340480 [compost metagenome]